MLRKQDMLPAFVLLVGCIHGYPFLTGYRLTADDVSYHFFAMNGLSDSWQFIKGAAFSQGRVVHFIDLITSLLGSYFADIYLFRVFCVSLFFANFILAASYFAKLSVSNVRWFVLLILFSFHPLDYFHLSPNSYPFKISFPVFLILFSRIALLDLRCRGGVRTPLRESLWMALCFFAMMFSEYAFSFALSLICIEFALRVFERGSQARGWINDVLHFYRDYIFLKDLFIVSLFVVVYMGFRFFFPSIYDGNQLPDKLDLFLFLKTLVGHIYGGTTFSSFVRYGAYDYDYMGGFNRGDWIAVFSIFFGAFISSIMALNILLKEKLALHGQLRYLIAAVMGLFSALLVTAPVAITSKYQNWCSDINACIFLDSSLSYLGFGIFFGALIIFFCNFLSARYFPKYLIVVLISLLIAVGASFTQVNNLRIEADMRQYVAGWERAKKMACLTDEVLQEIRPSLVRIVDPARRISFHSDVDVGNYWAAYIESKRLSVDCGEDGLHISELYPQIELGKKMLLGDSSDALVYLSRGWGLPEVWGTWSDGKNAEIILPIKEAPQEILIEARAFVMPGYPFQNVEIKINGVAVFNRQLTNPEKNIIHIAVPDELKKALSNKGLIRIEFQLANAISPKELDLGQDVRSLSIGLFSITVK